MNTRPGPQEPTDLADDLCVEWDALLRGEPAGADATGSLVTVARRLHCADTTPALTPAQRTRIWHDVLGSTDHGGESLNITNWYLLTGNQVTGPHPAPPPRTAIAAQRATRPRWPLAQLGVAALLALTLGIGYVALGSGWLRTITQLPQLIAPESAPDEARWVTSLVGAAASSPGVVDTPLLETTFAAQELPAGTKTAIYYQLSLEPDASLPYLGAPLCDCITEIITRGVGAEVVRSGAYTVRLDAPLRVQRSGSTRPSEVVQPGTEVTLTPGDAVVYPNYVATGEVRNAGDEPVSLIGVVIVGADGPGAPLPNLATRFQGRRALLEVALGTLQLPMPAGARTKLLSNTVHSDWAKLPPGPLNVALHAVTVPVGTAIGPYQPLGLEALYVESGTIARGFQQPGKSAPERETLTVLAGSTSPLMFPQAGVRTIVASTGDQPAGFLALLIEPVPTIARGPAP